MKVHPRQHASVIKHIGQFWAKGCKCIACKSVDLREQITVSSFGMKGIHGKETCKESKEVRS
jgi:hypothetical protein